MLLLSIVFYNSLIEAFYDELTEKNIDMLMQVKDTIDTKLKELWNISVHVESNPDLSKFNVSENIMSQMNAVKVLRSYRFTNSFAEEILLYYHGDNILYSSSGTYNPYSFLNVIYRYHNWNEEQFMNDVSNVVIPSVRHSEKVTPMFSKEQKYVTYMLPLPYSGSNRYATLIFLINDYTLGSILKNAASNNETNVIILDKDGEIITCSEEVEYLELSNLASIANLSSGVYSNTTALNSNEYFVCSVKSEYSDWTYMLLTPEGSVLQKPRALKAKALYAIPVVFLLGIGVIYLVMHISYFPIRKLKSFVEELLGNSLSGSNEIESVKQAFENISRKSKSLMQKIEISHPAVKDSLLSNLIRGQFKNIDEFNEKGKDFGLVFSKPYFLVAVFYLGKSKNISSHTIINIVEKHMVDKIECFGKDMIDSSLVFILSTSDNEHVKIRSLFSCLLNYLNQNFDLNITIGIGNIYKATDDIGKSYLEAFTAVDYRMIKGSNEVILFNDISTDVKKIQYPSNEVISQLELALLHGDAVTTNKILEETVQYIKKNSISLFVAKLYCYDIINTILKAINRINRVYSINVNYPEIETLSKFETVEQLADLVRNISHELCKFIHEYMYNQKKDRISDFKNYIKEHYNDYDFSVQRMADYFQITASNLSHYFKEQAGENITDYVDYLRIEKAKNLLLSTDDCLQDIVNKIGYVNVPSFIRKFKKITGITPGMYRELNTIR